MIGRWARPIISALGHLVIWSLSHCQWPNGPMAKWPNV
jgi:hypothetical protein